MQIFEYPYVIITLLVLCFIALGAVGVYFALQGFKEAKGDAGNDFSGVNKLESTFEKEGKLRHTRCLIYIGVSLDNVRSLYSDSTAWKIFSEIKPQLLKTFTGEPGSCIAVYDHKNFIALNNWQEETAKANIEKCFEQINRVILKYKVMNIVDINFGYYCTLSTEVSFDDAINRAKQACIMAQAEKQLYVQWDSNSGRELQKRIKIENNIQKEIDNNRFFLEYQPVIDAKTKKVTGAEVLSRLNSESDGVLTPGSFLSAVSSVGLNDKFDYYIFEKNCKWVSNNKEQREKYVYATNFSRTTLCDPLFAENIIKIIEKYGLRYSCMAVEILEDKAVTDKSREQIIKNLSVLREKGISVLLDDFGSGYTTFGDLHSFKINTVKIDKSVTQNAVTEAGFVILKNIIKTANDLGFKTVCEGIETKEHEELAINAGCDFLQGYYYYMPVPVAKLEEIFEKNGNF